MKFNEQILCDENQNPLIKSFHSKRPAGRRPYRQHHHTECELSVFISGSGIYAVNGRAYTFKSGDMFLFGSDEPHCITEIYAGGEFDCLNIHFEPRILWEQPENMQLLKLFFARNERFSNQFGSEDKKLQSMIYALERELLQKQAGYKIVVKHMLFSVLVYILRTYDYTLPDDTYIKYSGTTQKLKEALLYIDNNLEKKLTLKDIAGVACMSQTYFSAVFKKFNGISPWDYITIKRVENAIGLLRKTDMTRLEIAEKCGFSSSSNFYKAFYKITGKNPKAFCMRQRQNQEQTGIDA